MPVPSNPSLTTPTLSSKLEAMPNAISCPVVRTSDRPDLADNAFDDKEAKVWSTVKDESFVIANFPYNDPDGTAHFVAGAFYGPVRGALPRCLPVLLPPPACSYKIKDSPGKGKGLFATHAIQLGQLIVVERPSTLMPTVIPMPGNITLEGFYRRILDYLTKKDRQIVLSLANCKGPEHPTLAGIIATNGIKISLKGGTEDYAGLFPTISRVNHSCGPNSAWRFNYNTFTLCLYATRNIPSGTEITAAYLSPGWSGAKRLYELNRRYKFTCTCPYCTGPSSANSDLARKELEDWYLKNYNYDKWIADPKRDRNALIKSSLKALVMVEKEGVQGRVAYWHYSDLTLCYGALADAKNMKKWGWKSILLINESSAGKGEILVEVWVDLLLNPRKFPHWGWAVKKE
ncbi:SET domain-containing protein [Ramaria rubella]|nr:SET domain-containing protein [Ramaria rubella]